MEPVGYKGIRCIVATAGIVIVVVVVVLTVVQRDAMDVVKTVRR